MAARSPKPQQGKQHPFISRQGGVQGAPTIKFASQSNIRLFNQFLTYMHPLGCIIYALGALVGPRLFLHYILLRIKVKQSCIRMHKLHTFLH